VLERSETHLMINLSEGWETTKHKGDIDNKPKGKKYSE